MCDQVGMASLFKFLKLVGDLKHIKRTGWVLVDVPKPETIAGHMYRMGMMTFLLSSKDGLDTTRCMKMALVHDLAESIVGDITPKCGISKEQKKLMEMAAMIEICDLAGPAGAELLELFQDYELQESREAKTVKELDVLDMILQAYEYEKETQKPESLQEFFDSTASHKFTNPMVVKLVTELRKDRSAYIQKILGPEAKNE